MIELFINQEDDRVVRQRDDSPTVYLDHWALQAFCENQQLGARLTAALELRGGTLALSWANLAEFIKVTRQQHIRQAEDLVEANLPRLFFLEADPFVVIDREAEVRAGGPLLAAPHSDGKLLKEFFLQSKPVPPKVFTARDLFTWPQDQELVQRMDEFKHTFCGRVQMLRGALKDGSQFGRDVERSPRVPEGQRGTAVILRELLRPLIVDNKKTISGNDAIDLLHAVVPIAYCNWVLLDKYWETQINSVRSRFRRTGISVPIANVFSGKPNGVERFICELESS